MSSAYKKEYNSCFYKNHFYSHKCKQCGSVLGRSGATGRPSGTTAAEGFAVSGGRPRGRHANISFDPTVILPMWLSTWCVGCP